MTDPAAGAPVPQRIELLLDAYSREMFQHRIGKPAKLDHAKAALLAAIADELASRERYKAALEHISAAIHSGAKEEWLIEIALAALPEPPR